MTATTFPYGLKYGLISATASLLLLFGLYVVSPEMIFSGINTVGTILMVVLMIMAIKEFKRDGDDYITFAKAFQCAFYTYAVATFITMLGQFVLVNIIDPSLQILQLQLQEEAIINTLEMINADEETIEKSLEELEKNGLPSLEQNFVGYLFSLLIGAVVSAIAAVIYKNK